MWIVLGSFGKNLIFTCFQFKLCSKLKPRYKLPSCINKILTRNKKRQIKQNTTQQISDTKVQMEIIKEQINEDKLQ